MNLLEHLPRPVIFAHRGVTVDAPENSLKSFMRAIDAGAEAIELDTRLTLDGEVVVFHDRNLKRMTGVDRELKTMTLEELRSLFLVHPSGKGKKQEKIPTLEEVVHACKGRLYFNIELASYGLYEDTLPRQVCIIVNKFNLEKEMMFSSFDPRKLSQAQQILKGVPVALITMPGLVGGISEALFAGQYSPSIVHPHFSRITRDYLQAHHASGMRVHAWTVNDEKNIRSLIEWGVDGIITDVPSLARKIREAG